jgi:hypothetical protein
LYIPVSRFMVDPFVGVCSLKDPQMVSHEREVKRILKLKVDELLDPAVIKKGDIEINGNLIRTPWFEVEGSKVWGATAMILSELKELLKAIS